MNGLVAPVFEEKSPQSGNKVGVLNKLSKLGDWWSRERKDRVCCNSLPNNVVDCMIIECECMKKFLCRFPLTSDFSCSALCPYLAFTNGGYIWRCTKRCP